MSGGMAGVAMVDEARVGSGTINEDGYRPRGGKKGGGK